MSSCRATNANAFLAGKLRDGDAGYGCKAAFAGVMDAVETEVRWAARCGDIEGVEI